MCRATIRKEHGPVLSECTGPVAQHPRVQTLDYVGLPACSDTPAGWGLHPSPADYGLSLTLAEARLRMLGWLVRFAVLDNGGLKVLRAIRASRTPKGAVLWEYQAPAAESVVSAQHAYLITDIRADTCQARLWPDNALVLSRPAPAKTGTTNDYRDAWTVGYAPELLWQRVGGNADNSR